MMRGEFIRADGLIIPNNVSLAGAEVFLRAAFQDTNPSFWVGLVTGAPTLDMTMADMVEPTHGVNGYSRLQLPRDDDGWPIVATSATECYVESEFVTWLPVGGPFDKPVQRLALVGSDVYTVDAPVYALSGLMPAEISLGPATDESLRKFKYRLYI